MTSAVFSLFHSSLFLDAFIRIHARVLLFYVIFSTHSLCIVFTYFLKLFWLVPGIGSRPGFPTGRITSGLRGQSQCH